MILEAPHVFVEAETLAGIRAAGAAWAATDLPQRLARHHRDAARVFHDWHDVWLTAEFRDWNIEDLLPRIAAPTLVIQGADDEYGTPGRSAAAARPCCSTPAPIRPIASGATRSWRPARASSPRRPGSPPDRAFSRGRDPDPVAMLGS
jgi:pimeloyl-ACP methyl ester carboxylesterase